MIAIGIALALFGWFAGLIVPPRRGEWEMRDNFTVLPFFAGSLMVVGGLITLAWRFLP